MLFVWQEPEEFNPIADYKFWSEWETESSDIIDQLNSTFAQSILDKLKNSPTGEILLEDLQKVKDKIAEQYLLAKEISEYLSTLQDYLIVSNFSLTVTYRAHSCNSKTLSPHCLDVMVGHFVSFFSFLML